MKKYIKMLVGTMCALVLVMSLATKYLSPELAQAATRTVSWSAVTTYTDGSLIEAGNAVSYSIWREDSSTLAIVQIANKIPGISTTFDDSSLVKGRQYNFWGQASLATGQSSDNSVKYAWTLPLGKAATMGTITIN